MRAQIATASGSSTRSRASFGSAREWLHPAGSSDAAIDRAIEALGICRDKMNNRGVTRARLIATEACRSAANGVEFRDRVQREVGLALEIVDRETEAAARRRSAARR